MNENMEEGILHIFGMVECGLSLCKILSVNGNEAFYSFV